jgi:hypothetical protein
VRQILFQLHIDLVEAGILCAVRGIGIAVLREGYVGFQALEAAG